MKNLIYIATIVILSASCQKVIDVPVNDAEIQTVVEGTLFDEPNKSSVKISKSGTVYDDTGFPAVTGAVVVVSDDQGNSWTFVEDVAVPGMYRDSSFVAQPNTTYYLNITNGDDVYTSESATQSDIAFDSLDYEITVGGFGQQSADTNFFTFFNFTDNGAETNYYRAIPVINGKRSNTYYLSDDELYNGGTYRQPFFAEEMKSGDTLQAYLYSMDKANYTFFYTLSNNQGGSPFSPTPGNPVSNIEGGAIGYFGVYMTDNDTLIFP
ncbi:MAG: DUF4249 domain-containing protein [Crocinitomicaceae bacterium]|nr:DUF4249 domain-containing protein [Crocinitomicaceae bacterium]